MDYKKSLESTVNYIETHLKETISVEDAAREAGYSYYHLTRQFQAILGENVGQYIRRRRLSEAAGELLSTDKRILDIALDYGFESGESFSRAFLGAYHISPHSYRKRRTSPLVTIKPRLDTGHFFHLTENITVHPKIVELPEILTAGIRGTTSLKENNLPQLWDRFLEVSPLIPDVIPGGRGFGICEACKEGNDLYHMNDQITFSELAAVEVSSLEHLRAPFAGKKIGGGRYAVFTHTGSLKKLPQSYQYIWGTWFMNTTETLIDKEDFELYDTRFLGFDHPESEVDLYIPIAPESRSPLRTASASTSFS